jgi:hypothetical protein
MKRMSIPVVLVSLVACAIVACSSGSDSAEQSAGDPNPSALTSTAPTGSTCGQTQTGDACMACCFGPDGAKIDLTKSKDFEACECKEARAKCTPECAQKLCDGVAAGKSAAEVGAGSGPDDPCADCGLSGRELDQCHDQACPGDPTCAAAEKCFDDAKCADKP